MMPEIIQNRKAPLAGVTILLLFLLGACGTLQVDIADEPSIQATPNSGMIGNSPSVADGIPSPRWSHLNLNVTYVKGGNVWLWTSETLDEKRLTADGGVSDGNIKISDDGRWIAFSRGVDLWLVDTVNGKEKLALNQADMERLIPGTPDVWITNYDWVPGSHILAFNTIQRANTGIPPNDDLHLFDATLFEHRLLFPPGAGGQFHYSPDGEKIALVKPGSITLVNADGTERQENILTYTPARTFAEERYYAQPIWSPDSQSLNVPLLPADPFASPTQFTTVWQIRTDGSSPQLIGNLAAEPFEHIIVSADGDSAAYLQKPEDNDDEDDGRRLILHDLSTSPATATVLETLVWRIASEWSPDSTRFAYFGGMVSSSELPQLKTATAAGAVSTIEVPENTIFLDVRWLDSIQYLALGRRIDQDIWVLVLGELGGDMIELATIAELPGSDVPPYDFAQLILDPTANES